MNSKKIFMAFPLLAIMCSCQTETPLDSVKHYPILTFNASLPTSDNTRAHITYGNTDRNKEIFKWDKEDELFIYNMSKFNEYPDAACFITYSPGDISATFEYDYDEVAGHTAHIKVSQGDTLLVVYGETERTKIIDANGVTIPDPRNIVRLNAGTENNLPQSIEADPFDDTTMKFMRANLKMYDIVTATEDDVIPDIHFRHLSAILRFSIRNETGDVIYPTKLEFLYPETKSFLNTNIYCSLNPEAKDGSGFDLYDEFHKETEVFTDGIGTTINKKIGTADAGGSLANGSTYDLYLCPTPRIGNTQTGKQVTISLTQEHDTNRPYTITIDNFDRIIEPGKRYWFHLTAVEEDGQRKLLLTSEWLKNHPDAERVY